MKNIVFFFLIYLNALFVLDGAKVVRFSQAKSEKVIQNRFTPIRLSTTTLTRFTLIPGFHGSVQKIIISHKVMEG